MTVFWVVAPCSLVEVFQRFRGPCSGWWVVTHRPDDGGSKDLWNVGKLLPDYTALQPRRKPSSYSPPWEPQILLIQLLFNIVFFWTKPVVQYIVKWSHNVQRLGLSPSSGPNRVDFITWRRRQSQILKRRGLVLVDGTMDLVQKKKNNNIECYTPPLKPFRVQSLLLLPWVVRFFMPRWVALICLSSFIYFSLHVESSNNHKLIIIQFSYSFPCIISNSTDSEQVKFITWHLKD
jgi:hypothetical protein